MRTRALVAVVVLGACGGGGSSGGPDGAAGPDGRRSSDGRVVDGGTADAAPLGCLPYAPPSTATLRASPKRLYAHYFSPYPLSLDNQPPATDYYARNYLRPEGEAGAHAYCGGLLRERPLSPEPWPAEVDYGVENMALEVEHAIAIGLDGFSYDVLNPNVGSVHRDRLEDLLAASARVDAGFKILLVPDMTATSFGGGGGNDATALAALTTLLTDFGADPALERAPSGAVILAPFAAERRSAAFWNDAKTTLAAAGHPFELVPMTIGGWSGNRAHFDGVALYGASSWGTRTTTTTGITSGATLAHGDGILWMAPVAPQDSRPKDLTYIEATNSAGFRAQWDATIASGADWVQLVTWNDYSEDSEIAPSSRTGYAFYELSGYYGAWFKTGTQPPIVRDTLYYFHRANSMDPAVAPPDLEQQREVYEPVNGPAVPVDEIELVGFLTAPGTLVIDVGGVRHEHSVDAGIQTFRVPLVEGTPVFSLERDGATVVTLTSATAISNTLVYQDPLYHAGSSAPCAR